jgi:predicted RNA-binding Zn-ribbon protein involved in translation (DUF1610 family)
VNLADEMLARACTRWALLLREQSFDVRHNLRVVLTELLEGYELAPFELSAGELRAYRKMRGQAENNQRNRDLAYPMVELSSVLSLCDAIDRAQCTLVAKQAEPKQTSTTSVRGPTWTVSVRRNETGAFAVYVGDVEYVPKQAEQPRAVEDLTGVEADPEAPQNIELLPNYWDARRAREGKPDLSRCGADLRAALQQVEPDRFFVDESYRLAKRVRELEAQLAAQPSRDRLERAESILRDLASYVGNGGYNAPDPIDLDQFEAKIRDGIDHLTPTQPSAVAMLLTCPACGERHIDVGEFATKPHHTHACQQCGHVWRPAIGATVGVRFLPGFKNDAASVTPGDAK